MKQKNILPVQLLDILSIEMAVADIYIHILFLRGFCHLSADRHHWSAGAGLRDDEQIFWWLCHTKSNHACTLLLLYTCAGEDRVDQIGTCRCMGYGFITSTVANNLFCEEKLPNDGFRVAHDYLYSRSINPNSGSHAHVISRQPFCPSLHLLPFFISFFQLRLGVGDFASSTS